MAAVAWPFEVVGPYTAGRWRRARKVFRCTYWHGSEAGRCPTIVQQGERYYDTGEGLGLASPFHTLRLCSACVERIRGER